MTSSVLNILPQALAQSDQPFLYGTLSTKQPAPTDFMDPMYVEFDWKPGFYFEIDNWPAMHGDQGYPLPGCEVVCFKDNTGTLRVIWWGGGTTWASDAGSYETPPTTVTIGTMMAYVSASSQTFAVGGGPITGSQNTYTVVSDPQSAWNGYGYVAPATGWYDVNASVAVNSSNSVAAQIYRTGHASDTYDCSNVSTGGAGTSTGSASVYCVTGDVISLGFYNASSTTLAGIGRDNNWIQITPQGATGVAGPTGPTGPAGIPLTSTEFSIAHSTSGSDVHIANSSTWQTVTNGQGGNLGDGSAIVVPAGQTWTIEAEGHVLVTADSNNWTVIDANIYLYASNGTFNYGNNQTRAFSYGYDNAPNPNWTPVHPWDIFTVTAGTSDTSVGAYVRVMCPGSYGGYHTTSAPWNRIKLKRLG